MSNLLETILIYTCIPVVTFILGGLITAIRKPSPVFRSIVLHFAAGVVFSVVAVEILPDIVERNKPISVIIGFVLGTLLMLYIKDFTEEKENQTKTIVFLNLVCNGVQMILTVFFGVLGLFYLGYFLYGVYVLFALVLLFIVLFFTKKITIKGYSLNKLVFKIKEIPKQIHNKNNMLAVGRYLVFSHQYYFLFTVLCSSSKQPLDYYFIKSLNHTW